MFRKVLPPHAGLDTNTVITLVEKLNATFHATTVNSDKNQILQAILAEYNALRTEIQNRSGIQSTILQIHITAMTFILGGILTQSFGHWLVFLLPIEATLFGLWWLDHAFIIMELGTYIRVFVEPRVSRLVNEDKVMSWEAGYREGITVPSRRRNSAFHWLVFATFAGPALISLLYSSILIVFSLLAAGKYLPPGISAQAQGIYPGITIWLALSFLLFNLVFFLFYTSMFVYRIKSSSRLMAQKITSA